MKSSKNKHVYMLVRHVRQHSEFFLCIAAEHTIMKFILGSSVNWIFCYFLPLKKIYIPAIFNYENYFVINFQMPEVIFIQNHVKIFVYTSLQRHKPNNGKISNQVVFWRHGKDGKFNKPQSFFLHSHSQISSVLLFSFIVLSKYYLY